MQLKSDDGRVYYWNRDTNKTQVDLLCSDIALDLTLLFRSSGSLRKDGRLRTHRSLGGSIGQQLVENDQSHLKFNLVDPNTQSKQDNKKEGEDKKEISITGYQARIFRVIYVLSTSERKKKAGMRARWHKSGVGDDFLTFLSSQNDKVALRMDSGAHLTPWNGQETIKVRNYIH
eukprot:1146936-Amorphochlora_amoeboformis.AAC.3